jgi:hypothetical protein
MSDNAVKDVATVATASKDEACFFIVGSICAYYRDERIGTESLRGYSVMDLLYAVKSVNERGAVITGKFIQDKTVCTLVEYTHVAVNNVTHVMNPLEQLEFIKCVVSPSLATKVNTYVLNYLYAVVNNQTSYTKYEWFPKSISDYQALCEINRLRAKYAKTPLPKCIRDKLIARYTLMVKNEYERLVCDSDEIRSRKTKYLEECAREKSQRHSEHRDEVYSTESLFTNDENEKVAKYNHEFNLREEKIQVSERCIIDKYYAGAEVSERKYDEMVFTFRGGIMYFLPNEY